MVHYMKLRPLPYSQIESGSKTIELRLFDDKRQQIQPGDTIIFTNTKITEHQLTAKVINLHRFGSFYDLFESISVSKCGFQADLSVEDAVLEMRHYYSVEREAKYGVVGIEIQLDEK